MDFREYSPSTLYLSSTAACESLGLSSGRGSSSNSSKYSPNISTSDSTTMRTHNNTSTGAVSSVNQCADTFSRLKEPEACHSSSLEEVFSHANGSADVPLDEVGTCNDEGTVVDSITMELSRASSDEKTQVVNESEVSSASGNVECFAPEVPIRQNELNIVKDDGVKSGAQDTSTEIADVHSQDITDKSGVNMVHDSKVGAKNNGLGGVTELSSVPVSEIIAEDKVIDLTCPSECNSRDRTAISVSERQDKRKRKGSNEMSPTEDGSVKRHRFSNGTSGSGYPHKKDKTRDGRTNDNNRSSGHGSDRSGASGRDSGRDDRKSSGDNGDKTKKSHNTVAVGPVSAPKPRYIEKPQRRELSNAKVESTKVGGLIPRKGSVHSYHDSSSKRDNNGHRSSSSSNNSSSSSSSSSSNRNSSSSNRNSSRHYEKSSDNTKFSSDYKKYNLLKTQRSDHNGQWKLSSADISEMPRSKGPEVARQRVAMLALRRAGSSTVDNISSSSTSVKVSNVGNGVIKRSSPRSPGGSRLKDESAGSSSSQKMRSPIRDRPDRNEIDRNTKSSNRIASEVNDTTKPRSTKGVQAAQVLVAKLAQLKKKR